MNMRVNINGTSYAELLKQWLDVYQATQALEAALVKAAPHGRDYQTTSGAVLSADVTQYRALVKDLRKLRDFAEATTLHIDRQHPSRRGVA